MINSKNYNKEMNLNEWAAMFKAIYFPTQNYNRTKLDIFAHLVKVFGGGSKYLFRTSDPDGSRDFLAKIFGWYCALATRLDVNVEQALWTKYPRVCPRCLSAICVCKGTLKEVDPLKLSLLAKQSEDLKPQSLREWQSMFNNIYRGPSGGENDPPSRDRIAKIFTRMAEELGEVAETILLDAAIDKDVTLLINNEMADLGAWIFALANNLQYVDPSASGVTLADVCWNLYGGTCHRCQKNPCACAPGTFGLELASLGAMGQSQWDHGTGLANREALSVHLKTLDLEFKRDVISVSAIMLDLDDFGLVNKRHGHFAGDAILLEVATRMRKQLANKEFAFRRSGEEFIIIMAGSLEDAQFRAEKVRLAIESSPVTVVTAKEGTFSISVTASLGVSNSLSSSAKPSELEEIADLQMREAKAAGKNCVRPSLSSEAAARFHSRTMYE